MLNEIHELIDKCEECRLCMLPDDNSRFKPSGFESSVFMIVNDVPGDEYDVGSENYNLFKELFRNVGVDFYTMWKTYMQKCSFPIDGDSIKVCCESHLRNEIEKVNPLVIFVVGQACQTILSGDDEERRYINIYPPSYCKRELQKKDFVHQLDEDADLIRKIRDKNTFVNLHQHNQFSIRDGYGDETTIAQRLVEIRSPGFCLTNHGNINAHFRQYNASNDRGLKPIFGTEFYYNKFRSDLVDLLKLENPTTDQNKAKQEIGKCNNHLTVIAKNEKGYKNLICINNQAVLESFYRFPIVDFDMLATGAGNLFVFSGCPGSYISSTVIEQREKAVEEAKKFIEVFGDDFFIEIMSTNYNKLGDLNTHLISLANELGVKMVVTNDSHYVYADDAKLHEIMLLSRNDATLKDLEDETKKVWVFSESDYFIKNVDEIRDNKEAFKVDNAEEIVDTAIRNVNDLFVEIEPFKIDSTIKLPNISEDSTYDLIRLCKEGALKRKMVVDEDFKDRLKDEVQIITDTGYTDYFLILADVMRYAKEKFGEHSVGPGRGSAAASLVNYLLGITDINPLPHKFMLFERFMNPGRQDIPDIDCDFDPRIREDILNYIKERYGSNFVISIGNYGTNRVKSSIQDVLRAMGAEFEDVIRITKKLHDKNLEAMTLEELREKYKDLDKLLKNYPDAPKIIEGMRNQVRSIGSHAAGVVISGVDVFKNIPISRTSSGTYVTANTEGGDYHELSSMGFIKYDFLSLSCLSLIDETDKLIEKRTGIKLDWSVMEDDDSNFEEAYKILHEGDTYGIFQFASPLATNYLKSMKPRGLKDNIAATALLRPGPLNQKMHTSYVNRMKGEEEYKIPSVLQDILGDTFGVLIFQEQILRICQEVAGLSKEDSSNFRKELSKKERTEEAEAARFKRVAQYADMLIEGLSKHMPEEDAKRLWELMESFSKYGFNYVHAHCLGGNTKIVTDNGLKNIKNMEIGDKVFSFDYNEQEFVESKVTNVFKQGRKKIFRVKTTDGRTVECTLDHKFLTEDGSMKPLKEILDKNLQIIVS